MFEIYTIQMGKWRVAKTLSIELIDITVKSGNPIFAPSWDMVKAYKDGQMSEETYTTLYNEMMRKSYRYNRGEWVALLNKPKLALACYCKAGDFCHRHLLADMLRRLHEAAGHSVSVVGELGIVE